MHGAGVAGAIKKVGGPSVQQDSNMWVKKNGIVPTGCSTVTRGKIGQLECKYIIHTVGPIWYEH